METTQKDYRVTIKVRNNRILKAIEEVGGQPGAKWCDDHGLDYVSVNNYINMTASPLSKQTLAIRSSAASLCEVLGKLPEELWSNEQLYPLEKNFSELEMDCNQVAGFLSNDAEEQSYLMDLSSLENRELKEQLSKILTPREQQVIAYRFEDDLTLEETGKIMGVSPERIRQIETEALRKLRRPDAAVFLVDFLDNRNDERRKPSRNIFAELKKIAALK